MTEPEYLTRLERAWILIKAGTDQKEVVAGIEKWGWGPVPRSPDPERAVVRVDEIGENENYAFVAAVYAANFDILSGMVREFQGLVGRANVVMLRVTAHRPDPPHEAEGYVTEREAGSPQPGPTGWNPWG